MSPVHFEQSNSDIFVLCASAHDGKGVPFSGGANWTLTGRIVLLVGQNFQSAQLDRTAARVEIPMSFRHQCAAASEFLAVYPVDLVLSNAHIFQRHWLPSVDEFGVLPRFSAFLLLSRGEAAKRRKIPPIFGTAATSESSILLTSICWLSCAI